MFKMDHDAPTIRPRRIQNQNVIHRLERRKISSGKPGSHWHQVRIFHQNVFPNYTVVNVEKPPCFLRKFSPDGRYFIAFSSDQTSLEIYEYQGCQAAEDLLNGYEGEILSNSNDQRSVNIRGRLFERFFVLLHITNVASNGEHLNRECSLFTDDCRYVIVGSAAYLPEEPYPPFYEIYRNSESVTPNPRSPLEDYSLHIIDLHTGKLCDTRTFKCDKIILSHNQGLYLYKNILAILSVQQQTIHVFQVTAEGTFIDVRTIGRFCYEDDLLILSAVYPEVQRETQTGMANLYKEPFINSLKHRLLVYLWRRAERDGSAMAKRRFFQYFDQLRQLRMWKMQLLDESHLFIKYTSEDVVTLRVNDPSQPSFFVVYNMVTTEVIAVFENTSNELLELFENFCDLFRNATLHSEAVQFPCSASSNNFARQIQRRFKDTIVNAKYGGHTEAVRRLLSQLPISAQSYSGSPYLDLSLFSYDDKWVSVMERPKTCGDHPIRYDKALCRSLYSCKSSKRFSTGEEALIGRFQLDVTMNGELRNSPVHQAGHLHVPKNWDCGNTEQGPGSIIFLSITRTTGLYNRFYARDSGLLKFKIQAGLLGRPINHTVRRLVAFTFHPFEPFAISVQRTNAEYVVNFHMRHICT